MGVVKFLIYSSALVLILGILSDEPEVQTELRNLLKEFEPNIKKIVTYLDEVLSDSKKMDATRIDIAVDKKIKNIEEKINLINPKNLDKSKMILLKKLKSKIEIYEKQFKNKDKSTKKRKKNSK